MAIKHVGRIKTNKKKVIVAYRVVPGDADSCIVVPTESLTADEHDALIKAVESPAGQDAYEFGEAMARNQLPDGRNMLAGFHTTGRMRKMATSDIEMLPDSKTAINLAELNSVIAENKGVTVEDLALQSPNKEVKLEEHNLNKVNAPVDTPKDVLEAAQAATEEVMSDEDLAAKYRSDADRLFKEAKALREQAEALVPTKKKTVKT